MRMGWDGMGWMDVRFELSREEEEEKKRAGDVTILFANPPVGVNQRRAGMSELPPLPDREHTRPSH
jgi:hypothetical protein